MVVILDILHTFHLGFFDDYHIPITTNSCHILSAVVKVSGTIHSALLPSYLWQRSGFDK